MTPATEHVIDLLRKQVEVHGTVVWHDPEKKYPTLADSLMPEAVARASITRHKSELGAISANWYVQCGGLVDALLSALSNPKLNRVGRQENDCWFRTHLGPR